MFSGCKGFNKNLGNWIISKDTITDDMFINSDKPIKILLKRNS